MKKAFTMIELVFVIVVLGILAGVALPRLMAPADDARDAKLKSDVSSIRSAISLLRGRNMLQGQQMATSGYPPRLDDATQGLEGQELFDGNVTIGNLLTYSIRSSNKVGSWMKTGANTYNAIRSSGAVGFTYTPANGTFDCNHTNNAPCKAIAE